MEEDEAASDGMLMDVEKGELPHTVYKKLTHVHVG